MYPDNVKNPHFNNGVFPVGLLIVPDTLVQNYAPSV
jgi:hypothetical protein